MEGSCFRSISISTESHHSAIVEATMLARPLKTWSQQIAGCSIDIL